MNLHVHHQSSSSPLGFFTYKVLHRIICVDIHPYIHLLAFGVKYCKGMTSTAMSSSFLFDFYLILYIYKTLLTVVACVTQCGWSVFIVFYIKVPNLTKSLSSAIHC